MKKLLLILILLIPTQAQAQRADDILGRYWSENNRGIIEIYKENQEFKGRIIWRNQNIKDVNNPDPSKRDRNIVGMTFLEGFVFDPDDREWEDGSVYSYDNGSTYSGNIWLENEGQTLMMRGYVGLSMFGRTAEFQRLKAGEKVPRQK